MISAVRPRQSHPRGRDLLAPVTRESSPHYRAAHERGPWSRAAGLHQSAEARAESATAPTLPAHVLAAVPAAHPVARGEPIPSRLDQCSRAHTAPHCGPPDRVPTSCPAGLSRCRWIFPRIVPGPWRRQCEPTVLYLRRVSSATRKLLPLQARRV